MNLPAVNLEMWQVALLAAVLLWEMVWTGFALWHAARRGQVGWFMMVLLVNTVGVLPIIYLLMNKTEKAE